MSNKAWSGCTEGTMADVYAKDTRKAREQHKCCECSRNIKTGEYYIFEKGIWDGRWRLYKTCIDCMRVRDVYFGGAIVFGRMWDDFREKVSEGGKEGILEFYDDLRHERLTKRGRDVAFRMAEKEMKKIKQNERRK